MNEEPIGRFRRLGRPWSWAEAAIGIAIPIAAVFFILDVPMYVASTSLFNQQYLGLFLGLVMALGFLLLPPTKSASRTRLPWYDAVFAAASLVVGLYVAIHYPDIMRTMGIVSWDKVVLGVAAILLIVELTRRVTGWFLTLIVLAFILYARFGYFLPDVIASSDVATDRLVNQLFLGAGSIYGIALNTAALVVFAFVFFAHALFAFGGADFLFGVAERSMGRFRGGPAKISIVASAFFGMLSGSAVANVAGTGTITIPLMKKNGYKPEMASAVEAVASTGGTITPPVMGAAAFIIAEFLGIGYSEVVIIAIVPAVLYYLSLFIQVDLRAAKRGLKGLVGVERRSPLSLIKQGWLYVASLGVLLYSLFVLYLRPELSALYALVTLIVLGMLQKRTRQGLRGLVGILRSTSMGMLEISIIGAAAGIVIGVVNYTGLGLSLSALLTNLAGGSLLLLAIMTAIASVILGMGMPVTASYLLLAVLAAPALVDLGVPPLVAHMFVFYFGTFSFITPPVCLAVYTAASIGGASQMQTAKQALKLAMGGLIVPFVFIFAPGVVLQGSLSEIVVGVSTAVAAVFALSLAIENYFVRELGLYKRLLFAVAGVVLFIPVPWVVNAAAALLLAGMVIGETVLHRRGLRHPVPNIESA